jgi:hypothetical protein
VIADGGEAPPPAEPPPAASPPEAAVPPVDHAGQLVTGITEPHAALIAAERPAPGAFERWRAEAGALRPAYYRLVVEWRVVQPRRDEPPRLDTPHAGCMRDVEPCAPFAGVVAQLRALASRQRADAGRWRGMVVITGTPRWAASAPSACERPGTEPRSRAPRRDAMEQYRRLIAAVAAAAEREGAQLRYWSPWNEPNHPFFLMPQRRPCSADAPTAAARPYARLARHLREALEAVPGEQEIVLGELAGTFTATPYTTTVREFIGDLPRGLVCSARIWGQHAYVGRRDPVGEAARALRRSGCSHRHSIWVTETGAGAPGTFRERASASAALERQCRAMHRRLIRYRRDGRVAAAFQYTLREDDIFPTGLVTTALDRAYPTLALWQAWGARERPGERPPPGAAACG